MATQTTSKASKPGDLGLSLEEITALRESFPAPARRSEPLFPTDEQLAKLHGGDYIAAVKQALDQELPLRDNGAVNNGAASARAKFLRRVDARLAEEQDKLAEEAGA